MFKLNMYKIVESKSVNKYGEEVFENGDFRLEIYNLNVNKFIGNLKIYGDEFNDINGLIHFEDEDILNEFIKRLFDYDDSFDDLLIMVGENVK